MKDDLMYEEAAVTGWGRTHYYRKSSNELQFGYIKVVEMKYCRRKYSKKESKTNIKSENCEYFSISEY